MECTVRGVRVYFETYGEGMPILMIHGAGPDHRMMKGCMEPVFQTIGTAWKRIYFDLPGMGKTKGASWINGSDQMLELIIGFVNAIIPNKHFAVAGDSYGGYLARGLIHQCPAIIDGLLLICPAAGEGGARYQVFEKDENLLCSLAAEDRVWFTRKGICVTQTTRVWERFQKEVMPGLKMADNSFMSKSHGRFSFNPDALEKPFTKPTLMLTGRQDCMVGYRGLWQLIEMYPRASFVLLDKAGHALQIEQDVLFTATVKEWLERIVAEPG